MLRTLIPLISGLALSISSLTALAGNEAVLGQWNTLDRNGTPQSLVELYLQGDELQGRILKLYDPAKQEAVCKECDGDKHNKPIAGMVFLTGLKADGDKWVDGDVTDPESGSEYGCKLWLEDGKIKLKAGIGFITQTKEWERPTE